MGALNVYVNNKNTVVPKRVRKRKSRKSTRPESAVLKGEAVTAEIYKKPPTEDELEVQDREGMHTMFLVEEVVVKGASQALPALVFHDNGSNVTMIRRQLAEKLGLAGIKVKQKLVRSGGDVMDWETTAYKVPILGTDGKVVVLTAMGMEEISSDIKPTEVEAALKVFPQIKNINSIKRPSGAVDLLIGLNHMEVQPEEVERNQGLSLWKSKLGPRYLLGGTHPDIWLGSSSEVLMWTGALDICRSTSHASYKACHHTRVDQDPQSLSCRGIQGVVKFFEAEELGVGQPRRCDTCKNCVRCSYRAEYMTKVEAAELAAIEQNVVVDLANKRVSMRYPTKGDLSQFRDNQGQAIGCAVSLEKRLIRNKTRHLYNAEFKGYVERGVFKELTKHEMESWEGPVNYISHHGVPKPSPVTTALRLVSNSSLKNTQSGGISYNDFLFKGPNSLQPLLQVIADFHTFPNVVSWDFAKAYNTVYTFPEEMHMRRLVWRNAKDEPWRIFGIDRMHFGDRPAAAGLEVAKKKVAELGKQVDEQTADIITRGYVDDGLGGGPEYVVKKLIGAESFHSPEGDRLDQALS